MAAGIGFAGLMIPSYPWLFLVVRTLVIALALAVGCYRLWLVNTLSAAIERDRTSDDRIKP